LDEVSTVTFAAARPVRSASASTAIAVPSIGVCRHARQQSDRPDPH
jgi:hypothetical protein